MSDRLDMTYPQATAFIYEVLGVLTDGDFCETSPTPPPPADVYAAIARQVGWFIKLKLTLNATLQEQLEIWAFHPPERRIRTVGGNVVK